MRQLFPTALAAVFAALAVYLGYFADRSGFGAFLGAYMSMFGLYWWALFRFARTGQPQPQRLSLREPSVFLIALGLFLRLLLLFSEPNLSDDYARFLWDGHVTNAGYSPFAHPPAYYVGNNLSLGGYASELFPKLNSPDYYTVYPPVCQAVFASAVWLFPKSAFAGILWMKSFLWLCELGTVLLLCSPLWGTASNAWKAAVYALNPLAIIEVCGNVHFEGAMVFFLLAALSALRRWSVERRPVWLGAAALCWALATASKMLPLMFLPALWAWLGWRDGARFMALFTAICLCLFFPILAEIPQMLESIDLYFRQFQFNASVYYIVRWAGFQFKGWDIGEYSGPALAGLTFLAALVLALRATRPKTPAQGSHLNDLSHTLLLTALTYHFLSATVQPWYVLLPFALSLLGNWRSQLVWTAAAALSYSHYQGGAFQENYLLIALEYAVVAVVLVGYDLRLKARS